MAQEVGKPWTSCKLCFLVEPVSAFWLQFRRRGLEARDFVI